MNEGSVIPWQVIDDAEDARAFAAKVQARAIRTGHATSVSAAISFAASLFETSEFSGERRVLDVSGDGPNNMGAPVVAARADVLARGITINGLAIIIRPTYAKDPLDRYYRDCVIGGPGAFVLTVHNAEGFAAAIHHKLVLEVSGRALAPLVRLASNEPAADCLIGEKSRLAIWTRSARTDRRRHLAGGTACRDQSIPVPG